MSNGRNATRGPGGKFTGSRGTGARGGATRAPRMVSPGPRKVHKLSDHARPRKPRKPTGKAMRPWTLTPKKLGYRWRMALYHAARHKKRTALWAFSVAGASTGAWVALRGTGVLLTGVGFLGMMLLSRTTNQPARRTRRR